LDGIAMFERPSRVERVAMAVCGAGCAVVRSRLVMEVWFWICGVCGLLGPRAPTAVLLLGRRHADRTERS